MNDNINYIDHLGYSEAVYTGERVFEILGNIIEKGYDRCEKMNIHKILLNMCDAKGHWKELDRFLIGQKAAHFFRSPYKILVLEIKEHINKFAENTAFIRGVNILVTDDKKAGIDWLISEQ